MEIIKLLGDSLSEKIEISPAAARGLLKLSIKDEIGPFKPFEEISYRDLKKTLSNALQARLKKLGVKKRKQLINFLKKELKENQSLITMEHV